MNTPVLISNDYEVLLAYLKLNGTSKGFSCSAYENSGPFRHKFTIDRWSYLPGILKMYYEDLHSK